MSDEVYPDSSLSQHSFSSAGAASKVVTLPESSHLSEDAFCHPFLHQPLTVGVPCNPQILAPVLPHRPPVCLALRERNSLIGTSSGVAGCPTGEELLMTRFLHAQGAFAGVHKVGCVHLHLVALVDAKELHGGGLGCQDDAIRCDLMMARLPWAQ